MRQGPIQLVGKIAILFTCKNRKHDQSNSRTAADFDWSLKRTLANANLFGATISKSSIKLYDSANNLRMSYERYLFLMWCHSKLKDYVFDTSDQTFETTQDKTEMYRPRFTLELCRTSSRAEIFIQ